jgi:flagellar hook-associated protein 2
MSTVSSPLFTGVSNFAGDLQNVIARSVAIASMPLNQLQNQLHNLNAQSSALSQMSDRFTALQTAVGDLSQALGPAGISGVSSNSSAVSVAVAAGAGPATYTIDITDKGAYSSSISSTGLPTVADPSTQSISTSSNYTLSVNGKTFSIVPGAHTLSSLVQAINSSSAGVQASLVNVGPSGSPSYRLVVRSQHLAADAIQLNDGQADLLHTLNTGKPAQYDVDGLGSPIESNSKTVTLAPGVTVDLLQETLAGQPVSITVARDESVVQEAVSKFIDAYNSAVDAVDAQIGENAGMLSGHSIVYALRKSLSSLTLYTQKTAVSSLADLGVKLDKTGKLTLNAAKFSANDTADIAVFLGSSDGGGFLRGAAKILKQLEDPIDGALPAASQLLGSEISRQNRLIWENQRRVDELQTNLQQQMAAADALLAQLETKKTYMNNLFTAMINSSMSGGVKGS